MRGVGNVHTSDPTQENLLGPLLQHTVMSPGRKSSLQHLLLLTVLWVPGSFSQNEHVLRLKSGTITLSQNDAAASLRYRCTVTNCMLLACTVAHAWRPFKSLDIIRATPMPMFRTQEHEALSWAVWYYKGSIHYEHVR